MSQTNHPSDFYLGRYLFLDLSLYPLFPYFSVSFLRCPSCFTPDICSLFFSRYTFSYFVHDSQQG